MLAGSAFEGSHIPTSLGNFTQRPQARLGLSTVASQSDPQVLHLLLILPFNRARPVQPLQVQAEGPGAGGKEEGLGKGAAGTGRLLQYVWSVPW